MPRHFMIFEQNQPAPAAQPAQQYPGGQNAQQYAANRAQQVNTQQANQAQTNTTPQGQKVITDQLNIDMGLLTKALQKFTQTYADKTKSQAINTAWQTFQQTVAKTLGQQQQAQPQQGQSPVNQAMGAFVNAMRK